MQPQLRWAVCRAYLGRWAEHVPDEDSPREPEIDEVNARLNDAIKSCRSVVANYKALLAADQSHAEAVDGTRPSEGGSAPVIAGDEPATDEG